MYPVLEAIPIGPPKSITTIDRLKGKNSDLKWHAINSLLLKYIKRIA